MNKKNIFLLIIIFNLISSSIAFSDNIGWIEKGYGKTIEESKKNAKWNVIQKAIKETANDQSGTEETENIAKKIFFNDTDIFFSDQKMIYTRKIENEDKYVSKFKGIVKMDVVRKRITQKLISESKDNRKLPGIGLFCAGNSKEEMKDALIYIGEQLQIKNFIVADYEKTLEILTANLNKDDNINKLSDDDIALNLDNAGINFILKLIKVDFKSIFDKDAGRKRFSVVFLAKLISPKIGEELSTLTAESFRFETINVKEIVFRDAAADLIRKMTDQILDKWNKVKESTSLIAQIEGIQYGCDLYFKIKNKLKDISGDTNPDDNKTPIGRKITYKINKKFDSDIVVKALINEIKLTPDNIDYDKIIGDHYFTIKGD